MDLKKAEKKAKLLWKIWWISYIISLLAIKIYDAKITFETGESPIKLFNGLHIITFTVTALFFLPFMLVANHYARIAQIKPLVVSTKLISIVMVIWTVFNMIAAIYYVINR